MADLSRLDRPSVQHALLALVGLAAGLRHLHGGLNEWGGDNTTFLVLAGALRDGLGYVDAQMPYDPPHLRYPPGFPALLAVLQALGASLVAIKLVLYLAALGGLHLVLTLLRRHRPPRLALGAVLATAVSGVFLDPALSVLSDGVYLLLASGALLLADRAFGDPGASLRVGLLAGVLVGAATLMRMVGVALGPGLLLAALLARGRPPRARGGPGAPARAPAPPVTRPGVQGGVKARRASARVTSSRPRGGAGGPGGGPRPTRPRRRLRAPPVRPRARPTRPMTRATPTTPMTRALGPRGERAARAPAALRGRPGASAEAAAACSRVPT